MNSEWQDVEVGSYFNKGINFDRLRQFVTSLYCDSNIDNVFDAVTAALYIHQNISKSDVDYCVLEHANIAIPCVVTGKIGSIHIHMTV